MMTAKSALAMLLPALMAGGAHADETRAARWWNDVSEVASDANEGRLTGAPGHLRAAGYVEGRFRAIGLAPAGDDGGFRQQVGLEEQVVDYQASRGELLAADGATAPVALGAEMIVAARRGLTLVPDPLPNRNSFVRTDQFSFVRAGVPALSLKFGFTRGSEAFRIEHDWRANRYHAPSDDIAQPGVQPGQAIALDDYSIDLLRAIADAPSRPQWYPTSAFRPVVAAPSARR